MRAVVQRVRSARVDVAGETVGAIDGGLLVLLGVARDDTRDDGAWLAEKLAKLRLFADASGRMNANLAESGGRALVVSQFTLLASTRKGTRPSWDGAAPPDLARGLYEEFLGQLEVALGERVERGVFGADMQVALVNDGPVTLIIDSRQRE